MREAEEELSAAILEVRALWDEETADPLTALLAYQAQWSLLLQWEIGMKVGITPDPEQLLEADAGLMKAARGDTVEQRRIVRHVTQLCAPIEQWAEGHLSRKSGWERALDAADRKPEKLPRTIADGVRMQDVIKKLDGPSGPRDGNG